MEIEFFEPAEAAALMRCTESWLRDGATSGRLPSAAIEDVQRCGVQGDTLCVRKRDQPCCEVREVLDVGPLRTLQPGYFELEDIVILALLGVLGLKAINLTGLGAELGLENLATALADFCFGFELTLNSLQLVLGNYGSGVGLYRHYGTAGSSTHTIPFSVAATD